MPSESSHRTNNYFLLENGTTIPVETHRAGNRRVFRMAGQTVHTELYPFEEFPHNQIGDQPEERLRNYGNMPDGILFLHCDTTGKIMCNETIKDGKQHGMSYEYRNGITVKEVNYVDGVKEGHFVYRHDNGHTAKMGNHKNGQVVGIVHELDETGAPLSRKNFEENKKHGCQYFHDNREDLGDVTERHYWEGKKVSRRKWAAKQNMQDIRDGAYAAVLRRMLGFQPTD